MHAAGFACLRIYRNFAHHCVGAQAQIRRVHRGIDQAGRRVKRGMNVASAFAFTGAAPVAPAAIFVVLQSFAGDAGAGLKQDRKSTRLNSSHGYISYAVFCLKKKKTTSILHSSTRSSARSAEPLRTARIL